METKRRQPEDRFWEKVDKTDYCWNWTRYRNKQGYGQFRLGTKIIAAHRVSYEWAYGDLPEDIQVDHRCHNEACVRPTHLRAATPKQNSEHRRGANRTSKSGVRGVSFHKATGKWVAQVGHNGKHLHVGCYTSIQEAETAVIAKRKELHTHQKEKQHSEQRI